MIALAILAALVAADVHWPLLIVAIALWSQLGLEIRARVEVGQKEEGMRRKRPKVKVERRLRIQP